jgi:hypothetical protein
LIFDEKAKLVGYASKLQGKRSDTKVFIAVPGPSSCRCYDIMRASVIAIYDFREFSSGGMINPVSAAVR